MERVDGWPEHAMDVMARSWLGHHPLTNRYTHTSVALSLCHVSARGSSHSGRDIAILVDDNQKRYQELPLDVTITTVYTEWGFSVPLDKTNHKTDSFMSLISVLFFSHPYILIYCFKEERLVTCYSVEDLILNYT